MDNYELWKQREAELEKELEKLPKCSECGEHIQDEYCYEINGKYICESCMDEHRKSVETIIY